MRSRTTTTQESEYGLHSCGWSFCTLPLSGDAEQKPQLAVACGCHLNIELVDEQERHSGFQIVQQGLQRGLFKLAIGDHADKAALGIRALHVKLSRQHIAARLGPRTSDALEKGCARNRHRRAFKKGRTRGHPGIAGSFAAGSWLATLQLLQHGYRLRHRRPLAEETGAGPR